MAGTTPSQGIPYAERPDPFELTADLRGSFNKIDSVFAQTRGESTAALTAAQVAEVKAAQALLRALAIEDPVHVGPEAPADGSTLWVDTDEEPTPAPVGDVFSADIVDASAVGRNVLTAPLTEDARRALNIWDGTRAHLDEGTDTAERTWEAKDLAEFVAAKAGASSWDDVTDKPTVFPPASHSHAVADVTGLADRLDTLERDTGWRNIRSFVPAYLEGKIVCRRVGKVIEIAGEGLAMTGTGTFDFSNPLGAGWSPARPIYTKSTDYWSDSVAVTVRVWTDGKLRGQFGSTVNPKVHFQFVYTTTDAWPTTLPGAPA